MANKLIRAAIEDFRDMFQVFGNAVNSIPAAGRTGIRKDNLRFRGFDTHDKLENEYYNCAIEDYPKWVFESHGPQLHVYRELLVRWRQCLDPNNPTRAELIMISQPPFRSTAM